MTYIHVFWKGNNSNFMRRPPALVIPWVKYSKVHRGAYYNLHQQTLSLYWCTEFYALYLSNLFWSNRLWKHWQFFWAPTSEVTPTPSTEGISFTDTPSCHNLQDSISKAKLTSQAISKNKNKKSYPQPEIPRQQCDFPAAPNTRKGSCAFRSKMNTRHQKWIPKNQPASYDACT